MNIKVEASLSSWLRAQSVFDGVPIHSGQSDDPLSNDQSVIIVSVESTDVIARGFYKATASIVLATPCVVESALESHEALAQSLQLTLLEATSLPESFEPLRLAGADLQKITEDQKKDKWVTSIELTLAICHSEI